MKNYQSSTALTIAKNCNTVFETIVLLPLQWQTLWAQGICVLLYILTKPGSATVLNKINAVFDHTEGE